MLIMFHVETLLRSKEAKHIPHHKWMLWQKQDTELVLDVSWQIFSSFVNLILPLEGECSFYWPYLKTLHGVELRVPDMWSFEERSLLDGLPTPQGGWQSYTQRYFADCLDVNADALTLQALMLYHTRAGPFGTLDEFGWDGWWISTKKSHLWFDRETSRNPESTILTNSSLVDGSGHLLNFEECAPQCVTRIKRGGTFCGKFIEKVQLMTSLCTFHLLPKGYIQTLAKHRQCFGSWFHIAQE